MTSEKRTFCDWLRKLESQKLSEIDKAKAVKEQPQEMNLTRILKEKGLK